MQLIDALTEAIRNAARHNPDVQLAPACILWTDCDQQWEPVVPRLQLEVPELLQLGDYQPDNRKGPAIWLRCVIAGLVDAVPLTSGRTPILYLPGVSRQDLRAVESCPDPLKPLAELQYRGVIWSQVNAKDWTILAFLKSNQGGLGLDVAQDTDTKRAMQLALYRLLDQDLTTLRGNHLNSVFFNTIVTGDPVRDLLMWLDQGDAFRLSRDENAWRGFVEICKSQLGFDPENDGPLKAAGLLAARKGPWENVWSRFREAPSRYATLPSLIRKTSPPMDFFEDKSSWPQWNEQQETSLRQTLAAIAKSPPHTARQRLAEANLEHEPRRQTVWADLGEAPLAQAVQDLAAVAAGTSQSLAAGTATDVASAYRVSGWAVDAALLDAFAAVTKPEDRAAVEAVAQTIYLPWLDDAARHLQSWVDKHAYPATASSDQQSAKDYPCGHCLVFVDGLRLDLAKRLSQLLTDRGFEVGERLYWAALPSVTATAKPAVTPVGHLITGQEVNADFEPSVAATGQSLRGGYHLRKLLTDDGWQVLDRDQTGDPIGRAWTEIGTIDHEGHQRGAQLPRHLPSILSDVAERISQLIAAGWQSIRIVTDHGWLFCPGGLPKAELPAALSENTWGRCAAIKPGASTDETLYAWHWNPNLQFALAPGVRCYRSGVEYTHGGLSPQECVLIELAVTSTVVATSGVKIEDVVWKGMRCKVSIEGDVTGLHLDIRSHAGNRDSTITMQSRPLKADGTASVVVDDDRLEGHDATIVVINSDGQLVAQQDTVIGKNE